MKKLILQMLVRDRLLLLKKKIDLYSEYAEKDDEITKFQIERFNSVWPIICKNIPFYNSWKKENKLPNRIEKLTDLNYFPILTKDIIQENRDIILDGIDKRNVIQTGGSTGQPTIFPTSNDQKKLEYVNAYYGRSKFGIDPFDKIVLLWGHSHLFGAGIYGWAQEIKRKIKDYCITTERLNAYDLSHKSLETYLDRIKKVQPEVIIGYSSILVALATLGSEMKINFFSKKLKGVVATAETLNENDRNRLSNFFKVPIISEYGMAETGVIAYSSFNCSQIETIWDSFILQEINSGRLALTTLDLRKFPLIRYDTTDSVSDLTIHNSSIIKFRNVLGRENDHIDFLSDEGENIRLGGIYLIHLIKSYPGVISIQFKKSGEKKVKALISGTPEINLDMIAMNVSRDISKQHPDFPKDKLLFELTEKPQTTLAGKSKFWASTDQYND